MKHKTFNGDIDTLSYAYNISKMTSQKDRAVYLADVDEKFYELIYLLSMQMAIPQTIADLPSREERRRAYEELPEHTKKLKSMKEVVYYRVIRTFNERS